MEERWPLLSVEEKLAVAKQLNSMVSSMRCLKQPLGNSYIGHWQSPSYMPLPHLSSLLRQYPNRVIIPDAGALHHGHAHEQLWNISQGIGPFDSVKSFTDHFLDLAKNIPGHLIHLSGHFVSPFPIIHRSPLHIPICTPYLTSLTQPCVFFVCFFFFLMLFPRDFSLSKFLCPAGFDLASSNPTYNDNRRMRLRSRVSVSGLAVFLRLV